MPEIRNFMTSPDLGPDELVSGHENNFKLIKIAFKCQKSGIELKSKDIDQTDWQIQNTQFQDSLSETCNVRIWKKGIPLMDNGIEPIPWQNEYQTTFIRIHGHGRVFISFVFRLGHSVLEGEIGQPASGTASHTRADYFWIWQCDDCWNPISWPIATGQPSCII